MGAARDLLEVARTLLVEERSTARRDAKLIAQLTEACAPLSKAITLAAESSRSGTQGERAAWIRAERADILLREAAHAFGDNARLMLARCANVRAGGLKRI